RGRSSARISLTAARDRTYSPLSPGGGSRDQRLGVASRHVPRCVVQVGTVLVPHGGGAPCSPADATRSPPGARKVPSGGRAELSVAGPINGCEGPLPRRVAERFIAGSHPGLAFGRRRYERSLSSMPAQCRRWHGAGRGQSKGASVRPMTGG